MMPISSLSVKNKLFNFDYIYEQNIKNFLNFVIPKYFTTKFFQAVLESITSENGARMTAMDNAVRNAEDMISKLTVTYNRVRQAVITKELMEIISGAEAL